MRFSAPTGEIVVRRNQSGLWIVKPSDGFTTILGRGTHMVALSKRLRRAPSVVGVIARGPALALLVSLLITGCHSSVLLSSAAPPHGLGTVVGFMEGEGGAMSLHGTGTWRICGSVTATKLGSHGPTSTVSTGSSGQFTLSLSPGTYQLATSDTVGCSFIGKKYLTPSCVQQGTCYEAKPAPVVVQVTVGRESHTALI